MKSLEFPVLIVGAGPVGLSAAIQLARWGVRSLVVERHPSTTDHPKARGFFTRTMEVLLTGLKIDDIDLPSMSIRVLGKGRRERTLPLWKPAAAALRAWLAIRGRVATPEVFVNARGEALSRWGFAYLLKQHVATAARQQPGLTKKRVSPHVLRHTCAMFVLQATGDIRKVSLWLGHATLTTTEVYTRGDPTEKLDAMEAIVPPHLRRGTFQPTDKLIALLKRPA